jgi:hypothetical protein
MRLRTAQLAQGTLVFWPDLIFVALDEAQQGLVPHHWHLSLVVCKAHKMVHLQI